MYKRLQQMRKDHNMSQAQVATLLGVSMNHYGKYERGETDIPLHHAVALANLYGCTLDYLVGRSNNRWPSETTGLTKEYIRDEILKTINNL